MIFLRRATLVAGLACIVLAVIGIALPVAPKATGKDASLEMPVAEGPQTAGVFVERRSKAFRIVQPARFDFEPSAATAAFATRHAHFRNFRSRIWFSHVPQQERPAPLVVLLHGASRDGLSMIEMWRNTAEAEGLALLAPNSAGASWPLENPDPAFLIALIAEMAALHSIDPDNIYLFGHSDGAAYAQLLLNRSTGPWRAAALHAGFANPNWLKPASEPKPFRLYIGELEHIFPIDIARAQGKNLAELGHDNDLIVIPNHTHWFYEAGPQIAQHAWRWFASLEENT